MLKWLVRRRKSFSPNKTSLEKRDLRPIVFNEEYRKAIIEFFTLPDDAEFVIPNDNQRPDLFKEA